MFEVKTLEDNERNAMIEIQMYIVMKEESLMVDLWVGGN